MGKFYLRGMLVLKFVIYSFIVFEMGGFYLGVIFWLRLGEEEFVRFIG